MEINVSTPNVANFAPVIIKPQSIGATYVASNKLVNSSVAAKQVDQSTKNSYSLAFSYHQYRVSQLDRVASLIQLRVMLIAYKASK